MSLGSLREEEARMTSCEVHDDWSLLLPGVSLCKDLFQKDH